MIRPNTKATNFCDFSLELDGISKARHSAREPNKNHRNFSGYKYLSTSSVDVTQKRPSQFLVVYSIFYVK